MCGANYKFLYAKSLERIEDLNYQLTEAQQARDKCIESHRKESQARERAEECTKAITESHDEIAAERDTLRGLLRDVEPKIYCKSTFAPCNRCGYCQLRERITAALKEVEG